jgi:hypothetical protein
LTRLSIDNGKAYLEVKQKQEMIQRVNSKNNLIVDEKQKNIQNNINDREKKSSESKI